MEKWPQAFWAVSLIVLAVVLAVVVLLNGSENTIKLAVIAISSNIVSGALGYISGVRANSNLPGDHVTIDKNPTPPADPAKK